MCGIFQLASFSNSIHYNMVYSLEYNDTMNVRLVSRKNINIDKYAKKRGAIKVIFHFFFPAMTSFHQPIYKRKC